MKKKSYSSDILEDTLADLLKKKKDIELEIVNLDSTIDGVRNLLSQIEEPVEKVKQVIKKKKTRKPNKNRIITEASVRNAIIEVYKNPIIRPPSKHAMHNIVDGYFVASDLVQYLGVKGTSGRIVEFLRKFEQKGILESKKYKSGSQFRYIPPAETGPGREFESFKQNIDKLSPRSEPVPYTGGNKITFRNKDVESMVDKAKSEGFKVERLGSDHVRVSKNGTGKMATLSTTGRDIARYVDNCKADLKRIGVNV